MCMVGPSEHWVGFASRHHLCHRNPPCRLQTILTANYILVLCVCCEKRIINHEILNKSELKSDTAKIVSSSITIKRTLKISKSSWFYHLAFV